MRLELRGPQLHRPAPKKSSLRKSSRGVTRRSAGHRCSPARRERARAPECPPGVPLQGPSRPGIPGSGAAPSTAQAAFRAPCRPAPPGPLPGPAVGASFLPSRTLVAGAPRRAGRGGAARGGGGRARGWDAAACRGRAGGGREEQAGATWAEGAPRGPICLATPVLARAEESPLRDGREGRPAMRAAAPRGRRAGAPLDPWNLLEQAVSWSKFTSF